MGNIDYNHYIFEEPEERDIVVFPKGIYKFRFLEINQIALSKETRVPMLPVKLECKRSTGETTVVYDNIILTDAADWKLRALLKCICGDGIKSGRSVDLEDHDFLNWMKNQTGNVRLKVERPQGKDYDRNSVDNYIFSKNEDSEKPAKATPPPKIADGTDDIPF